MKKLQYHFYSETLNIMTFIGGDQSMLATTYNLNASFTKQAVVRVVFQDDGRLTTSVRLKGSHPRSNILLSSHDWKDFKNYFDKMSVYFEEQKKLEDINCGHFKIHFSSNAVILEEKDQIKNVPFVMQEMTFRVLSEVSECIDQHLEELNFLPIQYTKNVIIDSINEAVFKHIKIPSMNNIALYIKSNYYSLLYSSARNIIFFNRLQKF